MKELLKNILIPSLASSSVSVLANALFGRGIPVFMIHRMKVSGHANSGTTPEYLRQCLSYLVANGYTFVSLEEIIQSLIKQTSLPIKSVAFTMDDGFLEQGTVAAPIFLEFNCPVTFFVVTSMLDQKLWPWDAKVSWIIDNTKKSRITIRFEDEWLNETLGDKGNCTTARAKIRNIIKEMDAELIPELINQLAKEAEVSVPEAAPCCYQSLNWEMARELESRGIRFAPHSMSHRILSKLNRPSAEDEILGSWQVLERELANPVKIFCYPTGRVLDFGPREIAILKKESFLGAVSTEPGYVEVKKDPEKQLFRIPRLVVPDNMKDFMQYCSWIERAKGSS
ncbi:MAG: polysaccharide deacetylase family protein [Gammaproteobacteria bacterium]|nr:polysaccharide deacetylase family protein [Gammaproteobacteria bacterium]